MRKTALLIGFIATGCLQIMSQPKQPSPASPDEKPLAKEEKVVLPNIAFNPDKNVVTDHAILKTPGLDNTI